MKRTNHTLAEYSDYSLFYDRVYGSGAYWTGNNGKPIMPQEFVIGGGYFEKWSQELRVTTPSQYFIRGTVGGFFQRQLHNIVQQYTMPGYGYTHVTSDPGVPGNPNGFSDYYSLPNLPNTIWLTDRAARRPRQGDLRAVRLGHHRPVDAHGRCASVLVRQLTGRVLRLLQQLLEPYGRWRTASRRAYTKNSPCTNLDTSTSDHGIVPKVTLTWKIAPDKMMYATFSKGFRPGGVNRIAGPNGMPYSARLPEELRDRLEDRVAGSAPAVEWRVLLGRLEGLPVRLPGAAQHHRDHQRRAMRASKAGRMSCRSSRHTLTAERELHLAARRSRRSPSCQGTAEISGPNCPNDYRSCAPFQPPTLPTFTGPFALAGTDLPQVPKFKGNAIARYRSATCSLATVWTSLRRVSDEDGSEPEAK